MNPASTIKIAGVTGWPVHHSLSPMLHNYWLKKQGINAAYTMFALHPSEALKAFKSLKHTTISGVNVTIPLKEKAFEAADSVTPDARKLGVCNILYKRKDILVGHNTDMEGFAEPLLRLVGHKYILNNTVLVVGAGGAARAVIGALLSIGAPEIRLINRTDARAERIAAQINVPSLNHMSWHDRSTAIYGAGLVINASSAGMHGMPALDIDLTYAMPNGWVYDLVYTPQITPLLAQARRFGLSTIGGLDMLIAQARPSFQLLYGEQAPIGCGVKALLEAHLRQSEQRVS